MRATSWRHHCVSVGDNLMPCLLDAGFPSCHRCFSFSLLLCHRKRIFRFKFTVARILIILIQGVFGSRSHDTSFHCAALCSKNISRYQVLRRRFVFASCIFEHAQSFSVSLSTENVTGSHRFFLESRFNLAGLWSFYRTDFICFSIIIKHEVARVLRVSSTCGLPIRSRNVIIVECVKLSACSSGTSGGWWLCSKDISNWHGFLDPLCWTVVDFGFTTFNIIGFEAISPELGWRCRFNIDMLKLVDRIQGVGGFSMSLKFEDLRCTAQNIFGYKLAIFFIDCEVQMTGLWMIDILIGASEVKLVVFSHTELFWGRTYMI